MTVGKRRTYKYLSTDENVVPTADRRSSRHERLAARHVAVQRNTNNRYFIMLTRCDFQFSMGALVVVKVFQVIERISRKHVHSRPQPSRHSSMFMQSPTIKRNVIVRAALRSGNATSRRKSPLAGDTWKFPSMPAETRKMKQRSINNMLPFRDYEMFHLDFTDNFANIIDFCICW